jgi:hypothetical protein
MDQLLGMLLSRNCSILASCPFALAMCIMIVLLQHTCVARVLHDCSSVQTRCFLHATKRYCRYLLPACTLYICITSSLSPHVQAPYYMQHVQSFDSLNVDCTGAPRAQVSTTFGFREPLQTLQQNSGPNAARQQLFTSAAVRQPAPMDVDTAVSLLEALSSTGMNFPWCIGLHCTWRCC